MPHIDTSIVDASAAEVVSRPPSEGSERHGMIDKLPVVDHSEMRRFGAHVDIAEIIENANRLHLATLENGGPFKF